jgi:hypothetical protein
MDTFGIYMPNSIYNVVLATEIDDNLITPRVPRCTSFETNYSEQQ